MSYRPKYICNCPFYQKEYKKGICCEGIASAKENTLYFETEQEKDAYVRKNCTKLNPNCELYKLLVSKYQAD